MPITCINWWAVRWAYSSTLKTIWVISSFSSPFLSNLQNRSYCFSPSLLFSHSWRSSKQISRELFEEDLVDPLELDFDECDTNVSSD